MSFIGIYLDEFIIDINVKKFQFANILLRISNRDKNGKYQF
jgi:hypothetical protein